MIGDTQFPSAVTGMTPLPTSGLPSAAAVPGDLSALQLPSEELYMPMDITSLDLPPIDLTDKNMIEAFTAKKPKPAKPKKPSVIEDSAPSIDNATPSANLIKIPIIHTNDLHGAQHSMEDLNNAVHQLKSANPDAVLVDSGDAGNTADHSDPDRFEKVVDFFNNNGYLAVAPGNHEFQWGKDVAIKEYFSRLKPKVLSSNLLDKDTNKPLPDTMPYIIEDIKGVKVGFVGITTTKMATPQHPDMGSDLVALSETETLLKEVKEMKQKGAQVVVGLVHKGINDIRIEGEKLSDEEVKASLKELHDLAVMVPDIDVIAAGHDHKTADLSFQTGPMPHRTYIVEAGSHGNEVGEIDLFVDPKKMAVIKADMHVYPTRNFSFSIEVPKG
ncbi:MAG: metallophosphoesterase [Vulcanimicrobiota bacterium]